MIETNNTLSHPTGPEWQFLVGEGRSHALRTTPSTTSTDVAQEHMS